MGFGNVIAAAVAAWAVGLVWYARFGVARRALFAGATRAPGVLLPLAALAVSILMAGFLRHIFFVSGLTSNLPLGLVAGLGVRLFFIAPSLWVLNLAERRPIRLEPDFPKSHGKPRADDRRVLSGIIFINRNGLRWHDAPAAYGPHKTLYNRWKRWSEKGIFAQMLAGSAGEDHEEKTVMTDATYLKAHRTASSLVLKKGGVAA